MPVLILYNQDTGQLEIIFILLQIIQNQQFGINLKLVQFNKLIFKVLGIFRSIPSAMVVNLQYIVVLTVQTQIVQI